LWNCRQIVMVVAAAAFFACGAVAQPCIPGWHSVQVGPSNSVETMAVYFEGGRSHLFVGGMFPTAGGLSTGTIARWDGFEWSRVGPLPFPRTIKSMIVFDDGSGSALYAGGNDVHVPGDPSVTGVVRWNGHEWQMVGGQLSGSVHCLAVYDDGGGPALHVGGHVYSPLFGPNGPRNLMKLTGGVWVPLPTPPTHPVDSMVVFDDGSGQKLYVAGGFFNPHPSAIRWDGQNWEDIRGSHDLIIGQMAAFDDGSGSSLYLVGNSGAEPPFLNGIFRWNGTDWTLVATTHNMPFSLTTWDDGSGPALYVGGSFQTVNSQALNIVAKWDGTAIASTGAQVLFQGGAGSLLAHDDGFGPALYAGGLFNIHQPTRYLVRYYTCNHQPSGCYANCDGSTAEPALNVDDFMCFINEFAGGMSLPHNQQVEHYANCDESTTAPVLNVDDFTCFINGFAGGCP
jgi:trimeric autotransporter adhesin